jgi:hypothetical protein
MGGGSFPPDVLSNLAIRYHSSGQVTSSRRFPPPWSVEEHDECFIVRDADGQALGYFYFDEEQQSPAIDRRLTRDDARRMAVNFAKLPDLVASRWLA